MPDMNPENNRDTFQGRGVQIQQYRDALEKTKKNMMEMERDLYLKINELEKENEELKNKNKELEERLKSYTNTDRHKKYYENHKEEIKEKVKKYKETYKYTPTEEQKKKWARTAYLNKKAKLEKEKI